MCGIYGIIQLDGKSRWTGEQIRRMSESLTPRGPDDHGVFQENGVCLGMRRLAVIDPGLGKQPVFNEDGSMLVIYNGELYNHIKLRETLQQKGHRFKSHCDTEVILHAYEEYGGECVNMFNGMFAFAIYHLNERKLFIARDRIGIKPLYYFLSRKWLAFASEAKSLLPLLDRLEPDWTAINRFFHFGYVPSPDAPFMGIKKLPSGTVGLLQNETFELSKYWEPDYSPDNAIDAAMAYEETERLLEECVSKEMMSDVPLGIFLSGGLDSSTIAAYTSLYSKDRVKSFGIRFEEKTHDESSDARLVAEHFNIDHHEIPFARSDQKKMLFDVAEILDEPFGDSTVLPLLKLAQEAKKHVTVVLTGWGGDELFAGYPTHFAHRCSSIYRKLPDWLANSALPWTISQLPISDKYMSFQFKASRFIMGMLEQQEMQHFMWMGYFNTCEMSSLFTPDVQKSVAEPPFEIVKRKMRDINESNLLDRILHLDASFFLESNGLFQCDRMTMAASLESRVPLLNHSLIDFVSRVPIDIKMRNWKPKALLRDIMRPKLPAAILAKPKKGFGPPTSSWLRGELLSVFTNVFSEKRVRDAGVFSYEYISFLLDAHLKRKADNGRNLWALLSFQLWYEKYILGNQLADILEI